LKKVHETNYLYKMSLFSSTGVHCRRLLKNIGWTNQNSGWQKVVKSEKCMGDSQLLRPRARAAPPKVYAYPDVCVPFSDAVEFPQYDCPPPVSHSTMSKTFDKRVARIRCKWMISWCVVKISLTCTMPIKICMYACVFLFSYFVKLPLRISLSAL